MPPPIERRCLFATFPTSMGSSVTWGLCAASHFWSSRSSRHFMEVILSRSAYWKKSLHSVWTSLPSMWSKSRYMISLRDWRLMSAVMSNWAQGPMFEIPGLKKLRLEKCRLEAWLGLVSPRPTRATMKRHSPPKKNIIVMIMKAKRMYLWISENTN